MSSTTREVVEVEITPELAAEMMLKNGINRPVNRARVSQYARAMRAGRWTESNDLICLAENGLLLNGQHRLRAVIEANMPVPMLVRRGVPIEAMMHMDRPRVRSYHQQLAFTGEVNVSLLASTLRMAYLFDQGNFSTGGNTVGDEDMNIFLEEHPEIRGSVAAAARRRFTVDATPTAISVAHWWIARGAGPDYAEHYLRQVGEPINEPTSSAVHSVRRRLRTAQGQKWSNRNYVYLLVTGWNAYSQGFSLPIPQMAPRDKTKFEIPVALGWNRDEDMIQDLMPEEFAR